MESIVAIKLGNVLLCSGPTNASVTSLDIPKIKNSSSMLDSEIDLSFIKAGYMVRKVPKAVLQNINIITITGNFVICFIEPKVIVLCCVVFPYFESNKLVIIAIAIAYVEY